MNFTQPDLPDVPQPDESPARDATRHSPPDHASTFTYIFCDRDGLRAIWGIALFLIVREVLRYLVNPLFHTLFTSAPNGGGPITPHTLFVSEGAGLLCVVAATWLMSKIERRPASAYGFSAHRRGRNFLAGAAWGAIFLSLLVVILRTSGLLMFDGRALFGSSVFRYGLIWLAAFLLVALMEEVFLRGYLQFTLTRALSQVYSWLFGPSHADGLGFWTAAVILSFVFGIGHSSNPGESPLGLLAAALVGLVFCLSLRRTGSIWWAIGFHASWDWAQSFLYGVADSGLMVQGHLFATHPLGRPLLSGGLTGPEGSVFLLPILLAIVAIILMTLPRTRVGYMPEHTAAVAALDLP